MSTGSSSGLWPWAGVALLAAGCFSLSAQLMPVAAGMRGAAAGGSLAATLFAGSRTNLSAQLYERADLFFHKGTPRRRERAFDGGWFGSLARAVTPEDHAHLEGGEVLEILPWLELAARVDPHNIEIFRVAAFWLGTTAGRPDLARRALEEARRNNPARYELRIDFGELELQAGDMAAAEREFDAALRLWDRRQAADEEQALLDRCQTLLCRAFLHAARGEVERAAGRFEEILRLSPNRAGVRERLEDLRAGRLSAEEARGRLRQMARLHAEARRQCPDEDHDHEHEHEE
jgi:tetratricopeptide (TPR) repeat protein